jgi:hypothetical protein
MAEHYHSDQLVNPFTILRKTPSADGAGGYTEVEAQVGGTHLAGMRPLRGSEVSLNDGLSAVVGMLFWTWAAIEVRSTDVLLHNGIRYNVRAVKPPGLSRFQEIEAESGVVS